MTDKIKTFTVVIGSGAYTSERPYTMLRFAYTSLLEGHKINIFLVEDGIFIAKQNQNPSSYDNVGKWLKDVIEEIIKVEIVDEADKIIDMQKLAKELYMKKHGK